jgi:hypothetical protein
MKYLIFPLFCVFSIASVISQPVIADASIYHLFSSAKAKVPVSESKRWATAEMFEDSVRTLYSSIGLESYQMNFDAFRYAMIGYHNLVGESRIKDKGLLTVIDFTRASTEKRFFTIDLRKRKVIFNTYVSHGKNTGENFATAFSNIAHSNQSSLGFYVTAETYVGSKGYSLKLDGMDRGYNDRIRTRAVVMHEADYVSKKWINKYGRLGRSQGCPALPKELSRTIINTIKGGTPVFAYYNDNNYLSTSSHLNMEKLLEQNTVVSNAL